MTRDIDHPHDCNYKRMLLAQTKDVKKLRAVAEHAEALLEGWRRRGCLPPSSRAEGGPRGTESPGWGVAVRRLPQGPAFWMTVTVAYVARQHDLDPETLTGRDRTRDVCEARREAIVECSRWYSSTQIGRFFDRHHTTVLAILGRV